MQTGRAKVQNTPRAPFAWHNQRTLNSDSPRFLSFHPWQWRDFGSFLFRNVNRFKTADLTQVCCMMTNLDPKLHWAFLKELWFRRGGNLPSPVGVQQRSEAGGTDPCPLQEACISCVIQATSSTIHDDSGKENHSQVNPNQNKNQNRTFVWLCAVMCTFPHVGRMTKGTSPQLARINPISDKLVRILQHLAKQSANMFYSCSKGKPCTQCQKRLRLLQPEHKYILQRLVCLRKSPRCIHWHRSYVVESTRVD